MSWRDRAHVLRETLEERTGLTVQTRERVEELEEAYRDRRVLARELQDLAYTALNYKGGNRQELKPEERRKLVQKARVVWMKDALAGAAVDLMNEFVWGRGLAKPKAADPLVQEVIDEFWADPDNEEVLTTFDAQLALGVDLEIQCNLFMLVFDDGDDGKVKFAILEHDSVERAIRDKNFRQRVLYYLAMESDEDQLDWDYERDEPKIDPRAVPDRRARYYEHWRNVEVAEEQAQALGKEPPNRPPAEKTGDGKVFHLRLNRGTEMAFGHPRMDRLIRWYSAYNRFLEDRLDVTHAKAAFIMERQVKGSPTQLDKVASRSLSVLGELGGGARPDGKQVGPEGAGNILNANESVDYRELSLDTGAASAEGDGRMIRAPISATTGFPATYFGDMSAGSLATSTSLELPVLKAVETRQEFIERLVRFGTDRQIERAVESGRIPEKYTDEELAKRAEADGKSQDVPGEGEFGPATDQNPTALAAAGYQDQVQDEQDTKRDLSYEFKMPNPLRRMLADLVAAIMNIARTFDPNNTNPELSRVLLTVALAEGLELDDAPEIVERVFPPGYVDPAQQQAQGAPVGFGEFDPTAPGADGQQHGAANPYGAPMRATPPEAMQQALVSRGRLGQPVVHRRLKSLEEAALARVGIEVRVDDGQPAVYLAGERLEESRYEDLPADLRHRHEQRLAQVEADFDREVSSIVHRSNGGAS